MQYQDKNLGVCSNHSQPHKHALILELNILSGVYITATEVNDTTLDPESIYAFEPQRSIALAALRCLIYDKAKQLIPETVSSHIHGASIV